MSLNLWWLCMQREGGNLNPQKRFPLLQNFFCVAMAWHFSLDACCQLRTCLQTCWPDAEAVTEEGERGRKVYVQTQPYICVFNVFLQTRVRYDFPIPSLGFISPAKIIYPPAWQPCERVYSICWWAPIYSPNVPVPTISTRYIHPQTCLWNRVRES